MNDRLIINSDGNGNWYTEDDWFFPSWAEAHEHLLVWLGDRVAYKSKEQQDAVAELLAATALKEPETPNETT